MKKSTKKLIWKIFTGVFAIGFLLSLAVFGMRCYAQKAAENKFQDMRETVVKTTNVATEIKTEKKEEEKEDVLKTLGIEIPEKNLDFTTLQQQNPDIYAWIYVPGTKIDYPILQHPTDDLYYLKHNLDGSKGYPGCIYTELVNNKDFQDPNTVLYGHNMKNGSMFAGLHKFADKKVFDENQYIYIYTPEKTYVYQIFAAYKYSDIHLIYNFDLSNPEIFQNYLDQIFEVRDMKSNIREGVTVNAENHIVTLSTCISREPNKRFLVQGVLLNDEE